MSYIRVIATDLNAVCVRTISLEMGRVERERERERDAIASHMDL